MLLLFITIIFLSSTFHFPAGCSMTVQETDTTKTGVPGDEISYYLNVTNDEPYPVDFKITLEEEVWNSTADPEEVIEVMPYETVTFTILVYIPGEPLNSSSISTVHFHERPSYPGIFQYQLSQSIELRTALELEKEDDLLSLRTGMDPLFRVSQRGFLVVLCDHTRVPFPSKHTEETISGSAAQGKESMNGYCFQQMMAREGPNAVDEP